MTLTSKQIDYLILKEESVNLEVWSKNYDSYGFVFKIETSSNLPPIARHFTNFQQHDLIMLAELISALNKFNESYN
jgi:hypothetical protein